jgi:hypothetical protein
LADFSSNTVLVRQPIGSKDSIQEEKEGWRPFFLAAQNFELFSSIQDQNQKNQKPVAVDVLFKAYHFQG